MTAPNKSASGKGGITSLLHALCAWPALPERWRWHIQQRDLMDESSQYFRASLLAGETVARLQRVGHPADKAKQLVAAVINAEEFALMKGRHSFDLARFTERLRQLPD